MKKIWILLVLLTPLYAEIHRDIKKSAKEGDVEAMFYLGSTAINNGEYDKAKEWFEKAVAKNHAPSKAALGFMHFNGFSFEKNLLKARELYEQSAKEEAHQGLNNLAHLYRYGLAGIEKDLPKAIELLEQAAEKGNEYAVNTLYTMYHSKELGPPNLEKAIQWLNFGAKHNYPGALADLGYFHEHGIGMKKDLVQAQAYYNKAILAGSDTALSNLGYMYMVGSGVEQDYNKASELFNKAVKQGNAGAMINLAIMKFQGLGCDANPKEAYKLLKNASDLGYKQADQILKDMKAQE